jgi:hypothetical protein
MVPILTQAVVIGQDPATGGLNVAFPSGQMAAYPVKFGFHGPADGVRVNHPAMPGRGTWGIVAFPGGDDRAGVWISSVYNAMDDARTTNTDAFLEYNSHQSGYYETLDKTGQKVIAFPDGTNIVVGNDTAKPTTYRHVVDDKQFAKLQAFPDAERVPTPPSPFAVNIRVASGVHISIDPTGVVLVDVGSGNAVLEMHPSGTINLLAATRINIGGLAETLYRLIDERAIAIFNGHTHSDPQGGNTGPPNSTLSVGAETTTITFAG